MLLLIENYDEARLLKVKKTDQVHVVLVQYIMVHSLFTFGVHTHTCQVQTKPNALAISTSFLKGTVICACHDLCFSLLLTFNTLLQQTTGNNSLALLCTILVKRLTMMKSSRLYISWTVTRHLRLLKILVQPTHSSPRAQDIDQ